MPFDTEDMLDHKIDKLTCMMSKLSARVINQNGPFKPQIYQGRKRGQGKNNYYARGTQ